MCDYSLDLVASRPAKVGDKLVSTSFPHTTTVVLPRSTIVIRGRVFTSRHRACLRGRGSMRYWHCFSLGGSGTRSRSFERSTWTNCTLIMTPLSFPMEESSC